MAHEVDLQKMGRHLVDILARDREIITTEDHEWVFQKVEYGEPRVILEWPYLSVQPIEKQRVLSATRKFQLTFVIQLLLYHGQVGKIQETQEGTHRRIEVLERFINSDRKLNFVDVSDPSKDKVIEAFVTLMDHPIIVAGDELWSASRLQLEALSQELF